MEYIVAIYIVGEVIMILLDCQCWIRVVGSNRDYSYKSFDEEGGISNLVHFHTKYTAWAHRLYQWCSNHIFLFPNPC